MEHDVLSDLSNKEPDEIVIKASEKEKGEAAEKLFEQYLNDKNIPFFRIDQNENTYSKELQNKDIKRPDYLIYVKNTPFFVEVKYRSNSFFGKNNEKRLQISRRDIERLLNLQKEFQQDVWLAFTPDLKKQQFYFTTVSCVHDYWEKIDEISIKKYKLNIRIRIPNSILLPDQLPLDKEFCKMPDSKSIEEDVEILEKMSRNSF